MHSSEKHLSNARLFHVMATRVREGFELFTNDVAALTGGIARNAGDKASALEVIGEKDLKVPPSAPKQGLSRPRSVRSRINMSGRSYPCLRSPSSWGFDGTRTVSASPHTGTTYCLASSLPLTRHGASFAAVLAFSCWSHEGASAP
jgi:hypothetical protein